MVIQFKDEVWFYNYKSGDSYFKINKIGDIQWIMVTPDEHFLVLYTYTTVHFYSVSYCYIYSVLKDEIPMYLKFNDMIYCRNYGDIEPTNLELFKFQKWFLGIFKINCF